jgi:hypothetical protein
MTLEEAETLNSCFELALRCFAHPERYAVVPESCRLSEATDEEIRRAGFAEGGSDDARLERPDPRHPGRRLLPDRFRVLRDGDRKIVATWAENRWWTAEESHGLSLALVHVLSKSGLWEETNE